MRTENRHFPQLYFRGAIWGCLRDCGGERSAGQLHRVVEGGLDGGELGRSPGSPSDGDPGEGLGYEEAIPGAELPCAFGMNIKHAYRGVDEGGELDDAGFRDLGGATGSVGGDAAVVAVEKGSLKIAKSGGAVP